MKQSNLIKQDAVYTFDQFYTKQDVAEDCIDFFLQHYKWDAFDLIVEPSAGEGTFYNLFPDNKLAVEIDSRLCKDTWVCDSFYNQKFPTNDNIAFIGNPPFGTQNSESIKFFNHAAKYAKVIAFIIPRTWLNTSVQNRLDLSFNLLHTLDLPNDCFYGEKNTSVKCCFQIWEKGTVRKKIKEKLVHNDWNFLPYVTKNNDLFPPENADFVMLAYGSNPGQISDDLFRWRPKSVHFIKANIDKEELKQRFLSLDYSSSNNSARQSSLGKGKLIKLYESKYA